MASALDGVKDTHADAPKTDNRTITEKLGSVTAFRQLAVSVGVEKGRQVIDLGANVSARIRVRNLQRTRIHLELVIIGIDVATVSHNVAYLVIRAVRLDPHAIRVNDERVASDARLRVVGAAEATIDDETLAGATDWGLSGGLRYGRVAVDDVAALAIEAKLLEHVLTDIGPAGELEVGAGPRPSRAVLHEGALESLGLPETGERAREAAPHVPHPVERLLGVVVPGTASDAVARVEVRAAGDVAVPHPDRTEAAVLAHGNAAMEEEVAVVGKVNRAMLIKEVNVAAEATTVREAVHETRDNASLVLRQLVRMLQVERWEVLRGELVLVPADADRAPLDVHMLEKKPIPHVKLGTTADHLAHELEHDDGDCLLGGTQRLAVAIGLLRKERKLAELDAVRALENVEGVIVDVVAHDGCRAHGGASCGTHPADVVVAPLDIERVVAQEAVYDGVAVGATIIDVPHNVHVIDGKAFDERRQAANEVTGASRLDDRLDDAPASDRRRDRPARRGSREEARRLCRRTPPALPCAPLSECRHQTGNGRAQ